VVHAGGYVERPRLDLRPFAHACGDSREVLHATRDVEYVSSRAMVLDSRAIREIDLFDERFELSPYADVDLCARLRAGGWTVVSAGEASAVWSDPILPRERLDQRRALHRDRLLFAIRTTSTAAARHTFLQGEATNAGADLPTTERRALLLAYLDVQLALPDTIHASRRPGESGGLDGWMDVLAQAAAAIHAST
jgi:GT2 family glycosyltransferase